MHTSDAIVYTDAIVLML